MDSERGQYFALTPTSAYADWGISVFIPNKMGRFCAAMAPEALKVPHVRFNNFGPGDEAASYLMFPWAEFEAFNNAEVAAGRPSLLITAGGQPVRRGSTDRVAINVGDDRFIDFWVERFIRARILTDPATGQPYDCENMWIGIDNGIFRRSWFSPATGWDEPFPQTEQEYLDSIMYFFRRVRETAPDIHMIANTASHADESQFAALHADIEGLIYETFPADSRTTAIRDFRRAMWYAEQNRVALLRPRLWDNADLEENLFNAYMAYLTVRGDNFFFGPRWYDRSEEIPESYYAPIRATLGWYTGPAVEVQSEVWQRPHQGGIVYLNWSASAVTLPVPAGYQDPAGNPVTSITLPSRSGDYVVGTAQSPPSQPTPTPEPAQSSNNTPVVEGAYYVSEEGDDGQAGTVEQPWRTIQRAADTAQAGDTVYIRGGTYHEMVRFPRSGQAGRPIVFQNYPGESVVVQAADWFGLGLINVDWVVVDGLRVFGASAHGILISGGSHNLVRNCESANNGWAGVMITGKTGEADTSFNTVSGCTIHDNAHEGVYVQSGRRDERVVGNVVEYNTITGSGDEAVQNSRIEASPHDPPFPSGTVVRGNVVTANTGNWGMMQLYGDDLLVEDNLIYDNAGSPYVSGIAYGQGAGAVIRNNILVNDDGQASYDAAIFVGEATNVTVVHNTIYGHDGHGIFLKLIGGEALVANNIVYRVRGDAIRLSEGAEGVQPTHNLVDANPLFANPAGLDFHLRAGSPAIDAGQDVGVGRDAAGGARPQGGGVDIGAYEAGR